MGLTLMFLLALYQMQSAIRSEIIDAAGYNFNALSDDADTELRPINNELLDVLLIEKPSPDLAELDLGYPIGLDYAKNSLLLGLPKFALKEHWESKRQAEELPKAKGYYEDEPGERFERSLMGGRDSRGDNFMRFGRSAKQDFMRFGRNPKQDFMRFGRNPKDFMRFGRDPKQDFMRFGRTAKQDFMRFGRTAKEGFMRFGRNPKQDFMRFGRDSNAARLDSFLRFGRSPGPPEQITDRSANFMRFGRSDNGAVAAVTEPNQSKPQLQKNEIREAVKLLKQSESGTDESNPVDKAISMLFNKQKQQMADQSKSSEHNDFDDGIEIP